MGLPSIEERNTSTYCLSPKIYQAPDDNMDGLLECPRKKKMFSSSSFYEEPNCIYPTVEEQVKLCRQIAESLSDDCNLKSKGANMFFKRVKKAEKWIVAQSNAQNEETQENNSDPSKMPYVRPKKNLTKLKLILDPRQIIDMKKLLEEGVDIVEHNAVSPDICHNLVKDLNSPTGKGAQLFAKRKKKSEEWVVDENKVRHLLQERYQISYPSPEPPMEPLVHPRVKALSEVNSQVVAESIIRAAEAKVMTYPNAVPQMPFIQSLDRVDSLEDNNQPLQTPAQNFNKSSQDLLKYSFPKGWTASTVSSVTTQPAATLAQEPLSAITVTPTKLENSTSIKRTLSFRNFNVSPRAWNAEIPSQFRPATIKPIKPPSVLVQ